MPRYATAESTGSRELLSDVVTYHRSVNLRPYERIARVHPTYPSPEKYVARFGSRAANALLLLELAAHRKLRSGWDSEWYQGEFLSRLRNALFAEPWATAGYKRAFDWDAHLYQYETIDLSALGFTTKTRYRAIVLPVLRSFYDEEGLGGPITDAVRRAFRLPPF